MVVMSGTSVWAVYVGGKGGPGREDKGGYREGRGGAHDNSELSRCWHSIEENWIPLNARRREQRQRMCFNVIMPGMAHTAEMWLATDIIIRMLREALCIMQMALVLPGKIILKLGLN